MWSSATSLVKSEKVVAIDHDFFDLTREHRVIYKCTDTGVAAAEVYLQGNAAVEFTRATVISKRKEVISRIQDVDNAGDLVEKLCQYKSLKAVLIGTFPLHEYRRLEQEVASYQKYKEALDVQPDSVVVKTLMYTGFTSITGRLSQHELGKNYVYVVYNPSANLEEKNITITIRELEMMANDDETIHLLASSILRSLLKPIAVMQRTCGEFSCWKVRDNYVSFDIEAHGSEVVVQNAGFRVITDTILGTFPDIESLEGTTTAQDIQSSISEENTVELHRFARLMIEGKPVQVPLTNTIVRPLHLTDVYFEKQMRSLRTSRNKRSSRLEELRFGARNQGLSKSWRSS